MRSKKQNHLSVSREAVSTLKQTKLILGDLDLANAVNGCVHNEGDAVFIWLQIFRISSKNKTTSQFSGRRLQQYPKPSWAFRRP
jgi:hypothetical protein